MDLFQTSQHSRDWRSYHNSFPFFDIMEYTGNDMKSDIPLTTSLLKMFSMFEISMTVGYVNVDEVSFMCINCKRTTGLVCL